MNRPKVRALIPIMQAYADGAQIEKYNIDEWIECSTPEFRSANEYRIKPEPEEIWVNKQLNEISNSYSSKQMAEDYQSPECTYEYIAKRFVEADDE